MKKQYSEKIQTLLTTVYQECQKEDTAVRERQIREWKRLKLLWEGFQNWYDSVAHDWRIWDVPSLGEDSDQAAYDKSINVFKAYLESIIAALSVTIPPIKCFPDDADSPLDIATAKAGDKISQLIYRHNDVTLLWLHGLFIYSTEGMVALHNYVDSSTEYGTYKDKTYEDDEEEYESSVCPMCGYQSDPRLIGEEDKVIDGIKSEFNPDESEVPLFNANEDLCPACMEMVVPELSREKFLVTRLVGETDEPKSRVKLDVYGGLYVKVPNYARNQKGCPYLILSQEIDYTLAFEEYEHLIGNRKILDKIRENSSPGSYTDYGQWGRLSPQYSGEYPISVVTKHQAWIRPAKFNCLNDEDEVKLLKKHFPFGACVTFINEEYGCAYPSNLDDHWTLVENPMSDYVHFQPAGQGLVSVQDILSDLISLTLQTIEHGIGQTFADPSVVNFNAYQQTEVIPGGIFPATPKSGKSLGEGFHELKTATLSGEVLPFTNSIQSLGQIASGALPALFGGNVEGSETASVYSMSRAQALQRLQNTWKMFTIWWKRGFAKAIPAYIKEVKEDERDVQRNVKGDFVNVLIRKADLEGKIGKVELEANENLPITWGQVKDTIERLMMNGNPIVQQFLSNPENLPIIHDALGLTDFYIPGEDDVIACNDVIKVLLQSAPLPNPGDELMPEVSSVEVDPIYDNHQIAFETIRKWVVSEAGRLSKIDNPDGYRNVLLYGKTQYDFMKQMQAEELALMDEKGAGNPKKPNEKESKEAPIVEESDVSAN